MTRKTCYCQEYRSSLVFIWNEAGVLKAHFLIDIQLKNAGRENAEPIPGQRLCNVQSKEHGCANNDPNKSRSATKENTISN